MRNRLYDRIAMAGFGDRHHEPLKLSLQVPPPIQRLRAVGRYKSLTAVDSAGHFLCCVRDHFVRQNRALESSEEVTLKNILADRQAVGARATVEPLRAAVILPLGLPSFAGHNDQIGSAQVAFQKAG